MTQEKPIPGDIIKKAFDALDVLGQDLKESMIRYIERRGNMLDNEHSYSLKEIEIELADILGEDAAKLLVEKVGRAISTLKAFAVLTIPVSGLFLLSCILTT